MFITYTHTALPNGDCRMTIAVNGPNMGLLKDHMAMQLNTMKAFIEANTEAICTDSPPPGGGVGGGDILNFVEVAQHKQAQQANQNMFQQSLATVHAVR